MADDFFQLPADEQKAVIETAAAKLGRSAQVIEKDLWVCWTLEKLFAIPDHHPMAFKGGTSLSKAYGVINRFSEDIDITVDHQALDPGTDPFEDGLSNSKRKAIAEHLTETLSDYLNKIIVPSLQDTIATLPEHSNAQIRYDHPNENVHIDYQSVVNDADDYIPESVLIEFGGRNTIKPHDPIMITPDISELGYDISYPTPLVTVLSAARTFWEKATLAHVECNRNKPKENYDRLSRHWYDLYLLANHDIGRSAMQRRDLLEDVVKIKTVFFNSGFAKYDDCLTGNFKLIPKIGALEGLRKDYTKMISSGMFYEDPPEFDEIIKRLRDIEAHVNDVV